MAINPLQKIKEYDIKKSVKEHNENILNDLESKLRLSYRGKYYFLEISDLDDINITFIIPPDLVYVLRILNTKDIVKASIVSKTGLYTTDIQVIEKRDVGDSLYCTAKLNARIDKIQRRKHYRLSVNLPINCGLIGSSHDLFEASIRDISVGGMLLCAKKDNIKETLYEDQDLEVIFELDEFLIRTKVNIIAAIESSTKDIFIYRTQFTSLTEQQKSIIADYINAHRSYYDIKRRNKDN